MIQADREHIQELLPNVWRMPGEPFNLSATMASGQAFRWRQHENGIWWGAVQNIVLAAYQEEGKPESAVLWQTFPEANRLDVFVSLFRLDVPLETLYADWINAEPAIEEAVAAFRGLRLLRQPAVECFFSFQCASCNTVIKIERSVTLLAQRYGERLPAPDNYTCSSKLVIHRFPTIMELAAADEQVLRGDLWGYRAPRVIDLANRLAALGEGWFESLRKATYVDAHCQLMALPGVGPKVADCICLFSLDKDDAVPIDTHTRQIAVRLFNQDLAAKSLTARVYTTLADSYRSRFGAFAGWAQQYLFFAELRRSQQYAIAHPTG